MMLIKGGRIVDPASGLDEVGHLVLKDGKVEGVVRGDPPAGFEGRVVDAGGKWVVPGLVGMHVHLRDPGFEWKEDIRTGTAAASAGGGGSGGGLGDHRAGRHEPAGPGTHHRKERRGGATGRRPRAGGQALAGRRRSPPQARRGAPQGPGGGRPRRRAPPRGKKKSRGGRRRPRPNPPHRKTASH